MTSKSLRAWIWIGVAVVVVLLATAVALFFVLKQSPFTPSGSGPMPAYAPAGEVVSGFPTSILIDSTAAITKSYSLGYSSTTNQYTVEWNSSSSPQSLALGYTLYFQNNRWLILHQSTSTPGFRSIYAVSGLGTVNFVASAQGGGSAVVLSFVPPPVAQVLGLSLPPGFPAFLGPGPLSALVAVTGNASSGAVTYDANIAMADVRANLVQILEFQKWRISRDRTVSSSISIDASSTNSAVSILLNPNPQGYTEVQLQYQNM